MRRERCATAFSLILLARNSWQVGASFAFEAFVKAPNAEENDLLGQSVAYSADTLVVGADGEDSCARGVDTTAAADNGCTDAGAVYVFKRSGTTWALEAYVKATNAGSDDHFGYSVALDGDTLAVGAYAEGSCTTGVATTAATDNDCSGSGAAYVFKRSGTTWALEAYVKAPNAGFSEDNFGFLVAFRGHTRGTTWTFEAYVKATNAGQYDYFGTSVALDGDTLAVGAYAEGSCATGVATTAATDNGCDRAGAAYVFKRSGTTWTFEAYVKATNAGQYDHFGYSVALDGDTLAVGAVNEDSCTTGVATTAATDDGCSGAGAAYVFKRSGTTWTLEAYVKAPNTGQNDDFGDSVVLDGDTLAVGAVNEDSCARGVDTTAATDDVCTNAGAVYVFKRSGTTWALEAYLYDGRGHHRRHGRRL
ncbi:hypothetical protein AB1Y20_004614 [Prymnesium parvum]|uniref:Uncharacterized protein n=1 Tax=Prymnesium parvum TaxID=97485 RepID=A0AB34IY25_PRYPA